MKVIYTLIDVLTAINYDDRYMYTDLEKCICINFRKGLESRIRGNNDRNDRNNNKKKNSFEIPLPKDIQFLKDRLVKNEKCSRKFMNLIEDCSKNYEFANEYIR